MFVLHSDRPPPLKKPVFIFFPSIVCCIRKFVKLKVLAKVPKKPLCYPCNAENTFSQKISMIILIIWSLAKISISLVVLKFNVCAMISSDKSSWSAIVSIARTPVDKNASEEFKSKKEKIKKSLSKY